MTKYLKILAAFLMLVATAPFAMAQEGLYDSPVPAGSSYIRFLNKNNLIEQSLDLSGHVYPLGTRVLSDYELIPGAAYNAKFNDQSADVTLQAGKFYTFVLGDTKTGSKAIELVEDKPMADLARAHIYVYNYSSKPVDLVATVGAKSGKVIAGIKPGEAQGRDVNPFDVVLSVVADAKEVTKFEPLSLTRQQGVSVVVTENSGVISAELTVNAVKR